MNGSDWLRIVGVSLVSVDLLCLPLGPGTKPRRDLSAFFNLADLGLFVKLAGLFCVSGFVALLAAQVAKRWERYEKEPR